MSFIFLIPFLHPIPESIAKEIILLPTILIIEDAASRSDAVLPVMLLFPKQDLLICKVRSLLTNLFPNK